MDTNKLTQIGSDWQKNGMHRIYINDLYRFANLTMKFYASGNISSATLDGETISNSAAKQIAAKIDSLSIWYDYADDDLHVKYNSQKYPQTARQIMDAIKGFSQ